MGTGHKAPPLPRWLVPSPAVVWWLWCEVGGLVGLLVSAPQELRSCTFLERMTQQCYDFMH